MPYALREAIAFVLGCCLVGTGLGLICSVWNGRVP